ncbi:MAG TPA: hypothetical protein VM097_00190 [Mycobacteriales bacterium]|nr:hypothetical protein [Mycobacteriales bacterium]
MKRTLAALALTAGTTLALGASPAEARPAPGPASCQGFLASYANPNYAFILEVLVRPVADQLDTTVGALLSPLAQEHSGDLQACIPE